MHKVHRGNNNKNSTVYPTANNTFHLYSPAAFNRQATAATMAAPLPDPSSDLVILILFPGASSFIAAPILARETDNY